jgi:two-component sensor histidine kinase
MNAAKEKQSATAENENDGAERRDADASFPNAATVRDVLEAAEIGVWCWDVAANRVTWSSNLEAIHRLPAGRFDGTCAAFKHEIREEDRPAVEASLKQALRAGSSCRVRYRLPEREGTRDCWLEARGTVAVKDGVPERILGLCHDVTERVELEAELRSRVKQQEALAQLGERALAEGDLDRLLNDAVSTVALTLAVDFVSILELLPGDAELLLRAGFGWNAGLSGPIVASTEPGSYARHILGSRLPVITSDFSAETRFSCNGYLREYGCASGMAVTIAGRDNRCYGILGVFTKTQRQFSEQETAFLVAVANLLAGAIARRQLEQRHELMIRDMRHRSGNLFSQLLALFSQTARTSKNIADLGNKYRARVLALANAQRLITESGGQSIPIMDLLYALLGAYLDRITFEGPNVDLEPDPVFNLSAALHELADNAVKHGSLSRPRGGLDLTWSVSRTERGMTLALDWLERNGAPARRLRPPRRPGFGTRLIALVIERQLNGEVTRSFTRNGLALHMVVPLTHERWPSAIAASTERP